MRPQKTHQRKNVANTKRNKTIKNAQKTNPPEAAKEAYEMPLRITDNDYKLLNDLYNYRCLTSAQISNAYYAHKDYRRAKALEKSGYLESAPVLEGIRKTTRVYWLTQKAIELLDIPNKRKASRNAPHAAAKYSAEVDQVINRFIDINNLPIHLKVSSPDNTWTWIDSREFKAQHPNVNRNSLIAGKLIHANGKEYHVYIPDTLGALAIENQFHSIVNELHVWRTKQISRDNLIFCHDMEMYNMYKKKLYENDKLRMNAGSGTYLIPRTAQMINIINNLSADYNGEVAKMIHLLTGDDSADIQRYHHEAATHKNIKTGRLYLEILSMPATPATRLSNYIGLHNAQPIHVIMWGAQVDELNKNLPYYDPEVGHRNLVMHPTSHKESHLAKPPIENAPEIIKPKKKSKATAKPLKVKKKRYIFHLPELMCDYLDEMAVRSRSPYVEEAIAATPEYKEYAKLHKKESGPATTSDDDDWLDEF